MIFWGLTYNSYTEGGFRKKGLTKLSDCDRHVQMLLRKVGGASRHVQGIENESWVFDGKRVEQYSTEQHMSSCNLCI